MSPDSPASPDDQTRIIGPQAEASRCAPRIPDHELLRCIGKGSYGEVWLARNVMGTHRAVKIVYRASFEHDRPYEREFEGIQKFEPISRSHPSQLPILHIGRNNQAGYFYYVMELADDASHRSDGEEPVHRQSGFPILQHSSTPTPHNPATFEPRTLRSDLARRGRLPYEECLDLALSLTTALEHLHKHGLIHRDIKPANIVFVNGIPKLADIGLVTETGDQKSFVGTEGYFPPEGPGSAAGDIYGLGKVLYEMVTGRDRMDFPELPTSLDEFADREGLLALNEIILRACGAALPDRYPDAHFLRIDLEALREGRTLSTFGWVGATQLPPEAANSVAVLPFVNMCPDQENEFLTDGITEDLITALSQVKGLRVPARTSSFAFKGKNEDIRRIGQLLNVGSVVEGSVRKYGNRLRVTAQLVKVADGFHLWSDRFDRELRDVFDMQDDITRCIVKALRGELAVEADAPLVKPQTTNTEAYQLYLKGRDCWNERGAGLEKALRYFELALLEDPNYPLALTGVSDTQFLRAFYALAPGAEVLPRAKTAIDKALALDPNLAEAHSSLGMLRFLYDRDLSGAEESFRKALELNPNYAPAHYWFATLLAAVDREEEALAESRRSIELDPLGPVSHSMLAWHYLLHLKCEEAVHFASKALELRSDWVVAKWILGQALCLMGEMEAAIQELEEAVKFSLGNSLILATLSWACACSGRRDRALELLDELSAPAHARLAPKVFMALARAALGDTDRAVDLVEAAWREGEVWVPWLRTPRGSRELSAHPRSQDLLRRLASQR